MKKISLRVKTNEDEKFARILGLIYDMYLECDVEVQESMILEFNYYLLNFETYLLDFDSARVVELQKVLSDYFKNKELQYEEDCKNNE